MPLSLNRSLARHGGLWLECMQYNVSKFMFFVTVNKLHLCILIYFMNCITLNTKFCVAKQLLWLCKYTLSYFTVSQTSLVLGVFFYATT